MSSSLRLRVFAGPNGSGKSTMYRQVRDTVVNDRAIDLGVYVNPDDIAKALRTQGHLDLSGYTIDQGSNGFAAFAHSSGLVIGKSDQEWFRTTHIWDRNEIGVKHRRDIDRYAQLLSQYIVDSLLLERKKCSFETVFSHSSKLRTMRTARSLGYKVYLYYICTNDPEINIDRVKTRVKQGGHDVPKRKIVERYRRSLGQLPAAIELCYHAFMFDNTGPGSAPVVFAEMKKDSRGMFWATESNLIPDWFIRHYLIASGNALYIETARQVLRERQAPE